MGLGHCRSIHTGGPPIVEALEVILGPTTASWSQRLVWRLPCSGQAQCTSRRDFAPFSSSTHRVFHGERVGNNDHEGFGDGCEVRSAKTRHNTNCIQQGNIDRAQGCCLWSPVCRPREKLARSLTSLAPASTLTTPCLCSSLLTSRQVAH